MWKWKWWACSAPTQSVGFFSCLQLCFVPSLVAATTASVAFEENAVNWFQELELWESFEFSR